MAIRSAPLPPGPPSHPASAPTSLRLHALFFLAGGAGLAGQVAWTRLFSASLGQELAGTLAVLTAFFGGYAAGAWGLDRLIAQSRAPGGWFAGLELVVAGWGWVVLAIAPGLNELALRWIGPTAPPGQHWAVAFGVALVALFPAAAALGALLPAMERFADAARRRPLSGDAATGGGTRNPRGTRLPSLYAAQTFGAMVGAMAGAFVLLPSLGLRGTLAILTVVHGVCAVLAWRWSADPGPWLGAALESPGGWPAGRVYLALGWSGLLGIGFEVLGLRALSQTLENTVYTFGVTLAVFLGGTALGAALYARWGRRGSFVAVQRVLAAGASVACLTAMWCMAGLPAWYPVWRSRWGDSLVAVAVAEWWAASIVFGLPTLCMGALFSHLALAARGSRGGVGRALAANTLGGALAPAFWAVGLLPWLGLRLALACLGAGYLLLLPDATRRTWPWLVPALALLALGPPEPRPLASAGAARVVHRREGPTASVAVVEHADGHRSLTVNERFVMGGTGSAGAERRHALIPLLLHPAPRRALVLGLGTGITFGGALAEDELEADGVELLPEVVAAMPWFEPDNGRAQYHGRFQVHVADARRFVRVAEKRYDVIVADLFHPARDGAGALYTREHFAALRARLADGGVCAQWLPLFQLDDPVLRGIVRSYLEVFPRAHAWLLRFNTDTPVLGLMALPDAPGYGADWYERRVRTPRLREALQRVALAEFFPLFGGWLAGPEALAAYASSAPLNTDDRPWVTFAAPRFSYRRGVAPHALLFELLNRFPPAPPPWFADSGDGEPTALGARLRAYASARNLYLRGLAAEAEGEAATAEAAGWFLASVRASADFTTAYARCLGLATQALAARPAAARAWLEQLDAARPEIPVARQMLERLGAR